MLDSLLTQRRGLRILRSRVARMIYRAGIRANWVTIFGGILGIIAGFLFAHGDTALGIIALALSSGSDAVDGTIAREFEKPTPWGGILDLTLDRVVEASVLLGLIWLHPELRLPAVVVIASWYINITAFLATGAALRAGEKLIHYPPGLVERTDAFLFFLLLAVLPAFGAILCYAHAAMGAATAIQRGAYAWRNLEARQGE